VQALRTSARKKGAESQETTGEKRSRRERRHPKIGKQFSKNEAGRTKARNVGETGEVVTKVGKRL